MASVKIAWAVIRGMGSHSAAAPATRGPEARPPRLAAVATMPGSTEPVRSGRTSWWRSCRYVVAVEAISPSPTPFRILPAISPGRSRHTISTTDATMPTSSAGTMMRRRPSRSDKCPSPRKAAAAPTTIEAYATVTVVAPKWSRASYNGHSGVGAVPKAISTVKATATNQKPVVCEARRRTGARGGRSAGAGAGIRWIGSSGASAVGRLSGVGTAGRGTPPQAEVDGAFHPPHQPESMPTNVFAGLQQRE